MALSTGHQRDEQHAWLFEVIDHLQTHSLSGIPTSEQGELLVDALDYPLQSEVTNASSPRWPNPCIDYPNDRNTYSNLENRIHQLIDSVANSVSGTRTSALQRLLPLAKKDNFLTQAERASLATALWGSAPDYQTLPETGLFPHALLLLPAQDESRVKLLVRQYLYDRSKDVLEGTQKELRRFPSPEIKQAVTVYAGMAHAATNKTTCLFPTPEQALALFDQLVAWRPEKEEDDFFGSANRARKELTNSIGEALSFAISPALSKSAKTSERFRKLQLFYEEIEGVSSVIPAFVSFANIDESCANSVEAIIRRAIQDRDARKVSFAAMALRKWMESSEREITEQFPRLISRLIVIIESGRTVGLQQLIFFAKDLLQAKHLTDDQVGMLVEATPNAFNAANYSNIVPKSQEAISASSIRQACVKLAIALLSVRPDAIGLQELLKESKEDALPEVRFASDSTEL